MAETNVADHIEGDEDDANDERTVGASSSLSDPNRSVAPPIQPGATLAGASSAPHGAGLEPEQPAAPTTPTSMTGDAAAPGGAPTGGVGRGRVARPLAAVGAALVCVVALAPVALAVLAAVAALIADVVAVITVAILFRQGVFLRMGDAMNALSIASRVGFAAIGYLGLLCALMALFSGLLGRGRGRLFAIPGALLTGSALVLFATSIALCWPLIAPFAQPLALRIALFAAGAYLLIDTVTLAAVLADTRQTRQRALPGRRARTTRRTRSTPAMRRDAPPMPPTLASSV